MILFLKIKNYLRKICKMDIMLIFFFIKKHSLKLFMRVPDFNVVKKIGGIYFEYDFSLGPIIKKMYKETYGLPVIYNIRKYLNEGDTFIDVGANIGYISAIATNIVGKKGEIHSFEPVPLYFNKLIKLKKINNQFSIHINQCALGNKKRNTFIYQTKYDRIGDNTMILKFLKSNNVDKKINIKEIRLDEYITKNSIKNIKLIKIDVEGYEYFVLKGLSNFLKMVDDKPIIICEIQPKAYELLNVNILELEKYMENFSYKAYHAYNNNTKIKISQINEISDVIFIPKNRK
jgi:FkbM family methyltransferase